MTKEELETIAETLQDSRMELKRLITINQQGGERPSFVKYAKSLISKLEESYAIISKEYLKLK